jgi:ABC-type antimicrobial peptide transport system permease subunit
MKAIQQQVGKVSPDVPLTNSGTLGDLYTKSMARTSFTLVILCVSGGIALFLGSVGIYGVIAYSVAQRTRRIRTPAALGARRRTAVEASVRQGMLLTVPGIAIGLMIAFATMPFMSTLLYGVSANDPTTYIATASAVVIATLLACYLSSRHTAAGDTMQALRTE